jgi:hypothetical protein
MTLPEGLRPGDLISFKHSVGIGSYPNHVSLFHAGTPVLVIEIFHDILKRYSIWNKSLTGHSYMFLTPDGRIIAQGPPKDAGYFSIHFLWNNELIFLFQVHHSDIQIITATN